MSFGKKWIDWIKTIFFSARMSILVNGSLTKEFKPERGLRPGAPMSPLLFLIVGKILHCMFERAKEKNIFQEIIYGSQGNQISHLQFADDTILFLQKKIHSIVGIKSVLHYFELLSGLKINLSKTSSR